MSMSLLKKSMAIVEEDLADNKKAKAKQIGKKKKVLHRWDHSANEAFFKNQAQKKTIDEIRKELHSGNQRAEDNVKKLLSLTKHTVKIPNAEKILKSAHRGRYIVEEEQKPVEEESLFTEEDFAAFEKELAQTITSDSI